MLFFFILYEFQATAGMIIILNTSGLLKEMLFFFILFEFQATTGMIIILKATEKCSTCPLILRYCHW